MTQLRYQKTFQDPDLDFSAAILIYDKNLQRTHGRLIKKFPLRYGVQAGERLKDIKNFPLHIENLLKLLEGKNQKGLTVVAFGGGSVGDFAGFFASVFKRGIDLINIPSTWLAAVDSAHGGKTGLNAGGSKNQIGTFHSAKKVFLLESVLLSQPKERAHDGRGELLKMAMLRGGTLWKKMSNLQEFTAEDFWKLIPLAIQGKNEIVAQDPFEKKGYRQILNLGHTLGHVIEAALGVSHGQAIGQGLVFAIRWSLQKGYLGQKNYAAISENPTYLEFEAQLNRSLKKLTVPKVRKLLSMDKKKAQKDSLIFVFPVRPGLCARQKVKVEEVVRAFVRQKQ